MAAVELMVRPYSFVSPVDPAVRDNREIRRERVTRELLTIERPSD